MPLHLDYRPKTLNDVEGNQEVIATLRTVLAKEDSPRTFLLTGPSGCGKTTLGRIICRELGAADMEVHEINAANTRGIDDVRAIEEKMHYAPISGTKRAWIIDECHALTGAAASCLLKMLEDTPPHVVFVLCTTDPQKMLETIRTRCTTFTVASLPERNLVRLMRRVVLAEKKTVSDDVLAQIATDALGSARMALVILDKVIDLPPEQQASAAKQRATEQSEIIELCRALIGNKPWVTIAGMLKRLEGQEPETVRRAVLGYLRSCLLAKGDQRTFLLIECFRDPYFNTGNAGLAASCYAATSVGGR